MNFSLVVDELAAVRYRHMLKRTMGVDQVRFSRNDDAGDDVLWIKEAFCGEEQIIIIVRDCESFLFKPVCTVEPYLLIAIAGNGGGLAIRAYQFKGCGIKGVTADLVDDRASGLGIKNTLFIPGHGVLQRVKNDIG